MSAIHYDNPETPEAFIAVLEARDVHLPVVPSEIEGGVIDDARGRPLIVIDVNRERPDEEVEAITAYLCMAINNCGGFRAIGAVVGDLEADHGSR